MERWITSSVEDRESALVSIRYGVTRSFIMLLYWNWCSYRLEMGVSGNLWIVVKDVKPLVVYDVECEMAMDSMKGKCASSWVDLWYTNLFCIPELTSVFFSCCDSVLGYSHSSIREIEVLTSLIGNMEHLTKKCWGIGPHLAATGSLMSFLELRQAVGVYIRVTTGMPILNGSLFSEVRTPV